MSAHQTRLTSPQPDRRSSLRPCNVQPLSNVFLAFALSTPWTKSVLCLSQARKESPTPASHPASQRWQLAAAAGAVARSAGRGEGAPVMEVTMHQAAADHEQQLGSALHPKPVRMATTFTLFPPTDPSQSSPTERSTCWTCCGAAPPKPRWTRPLPRVATCLANAGPRFGALAAVHRPRRFPLFCDCVNKLDAARSVSQTGTSFCPAPNCASTGVY